MENVLKEIQYNEICETMLTCCVQIVQVTSMSKSIDNVFTHIETDGKIINNLATYMFRTMELERNNSKALWPTNRACIESFIEFRNFEKFCEVAQRMLRGFKNLHFNMERNPRRVKCLCWPEQTDPYHMYTVLLSIKNAKQKDFDRAYTNLVFFSFDKNEHDRIMGKYNSESLQTSIDALNAMGCFLILINAQKKNSANIHEFLEPYAKSTIEEFKKYSGKESNQIFTRSQARKQTDHPGKAN